MLTALFIEYCFMDGPNKCAVSHERSYLCHTSTPVNNFFLFLTLHPGNRCCIILKRGSGHCRGNISVSVAFYLVAQEYLWFWGHVCLFGHQFVPLSHGGDAFWCILYYKCWRPGPHEAKKGESKLHYWTAFGGYWNKSDIPNLSNFATQGQNEILTDNFMAG